MYPNIKGGNIIGSQQIVTILMNRKNIILFERYDGVRFVLERSLTKYKDNISIYSSNMKNDIKNLLKANQVDLLITELSHVNPDGLALSCYARKLAPSLKIIWITVLGCHIFKNQKERLGNIQCLEKPLEINSFRKDVLLALEINEVQINNC
jgi:DNA-binding NtrC family response regulator